MTHLEPERLALRLQELSQRRAVLLAALEGQLAPSLTVEERTGIREAISKVEEEIAEVRKRLAAF